MKTALVFLMMLVFAHHPTRPEWYVAPIYRGAVVAGVMMSNSNPKGTT